MFLRIGFHVEIGCHFSIKSLHEINYPFCGVVNGTKDIWLPADLNKSKEAEDRPAEDNINKSNHKIRKTFISSLFDNNMNIDTIRETAGHADERTSLNNYCFNQDDTTELEAKLEECKNAMTATFQITS